MKKIIIFGFVFMMMAYVVYGADSLLTSLEAVYDFEDITGNLTEPINNYDSTYVNVVSQNVGGIENNAWNFSSSTTKIPSGIIDGLTEFTISCWEYPYNFNAFGCVWQSQASGGNVDLLCTSATTGNAYYRIFTSGVNTINSGTPLSSLSWNNILMSYDGDIFRGFVNGNLVGSLSTNNLSVSSELQSAFGSYHDGNSPINGMIDECYFYSRNLTNDEIHRLYNNGTGYFYPYFSEPPAPAVDNYNLTILLYDKNNNYLSSIDENDIFKIYGNYTLSDEYLISGNCYFNASNISAHFSTDGNDFLIDDNLKEVAIYINESSDDLNSDTYIFHVCRNGTIPVNLDIYANASYFDTISSSVIPSCLSGFHEENKNIYNFSNADSFNLTLRCNDCNTPPEKIKILSRDGELLTYERNLNKHFENMTYNTTLNLYAFEDGFYSYNTIGVNVSNITIFCNSTNTTLTQDVINNDLTIDILSINDESFYDGIKIEYNYSNTILIEIYGDVITDIDFNVTYGNGTLIKNTNQEFMFLNTSQLNEVTIYNISISATDNDNQMTYKKGYFEINDTISPNMIFYLPLEDNSSTYTDTPITIAIAMNDTRSLLYFFYNITEIQTSPYLPDTEAVIYSEYVNLTTEGNAYFYLNSLDFSNVSNGDKTLNAVVCDTHTKKYVKNKLIKIDTIKSPNSIEFKDKERNIKIKSLNGNSNKINTYINDDRIKIEFEFGSFEAVKEFEVSGKNIKYLYNSDFKGHFIIDDYYWLDFENSGNVYVEQKNENKYIVYVNNPDDIIRFESLGIINCQYKTIKFGYETAYSPDDYELINFDLSKSSNVMILGILAVIYLIFLIMAFVLQSFAFLGISFFLSLIIAVILGNIHILLFIGMSVFNAVLLLTYSGKFKK